MLFILQNNLFKQLDYCLFRKNNKSRPFDLLLILVEMTGFEPAASASRTQRSTKLSHISLFNKII